MWWIDPWLEEWWAHCGQCISDDAYKTTVYSWHWQWYWHVWRMDGMPVTVM